MKLRQRRESKKDSFTLSQLAVERNGKNIIHGKWQKKMPNPDYLPSFICGLMKMESLFLTMKTRRYIIKITCQSLARQRMAKKPEIDTCTFQKNGDGKIWPRSETLGNPVDDKTFGKSRRKLSSFFVTHILMSISMSLIYHFDAKFHVISRDRNA